MSTYAVHENDFAALSFSYQKNIFASVRKETRQKRQNLNML